MLGVDVGGALLVGQGGGAGHDALALVVLAEGQLYKGQAVLGAVGQGHVLVVALEHVALRHLHAVAADGAGRIHGGGALESVLHGAHAQDGGGFPLGPVQML